MSNPSEIKSKRYRNWLKGTLALRYLQNGLYPFIDRVVKEEHAKIVQYLMPCTSCTIEKILPDHAGSKVCIQRNKTRCNCRKKTNSNCATCSKIYDKIILQNRFREPVWLTDCSTWYNDHWQFAKCFMATITRMETNNTAAETRVTGLLSIIINGLFFQSEIQCNIDPPNDSFSQVREIANEIMHNPTLELTDQDLARYLQSMIAVLEDKKTLSLDPEAQTAAIQIKQVFNDAIISTNDEAVAIETAVDALNEAKKQSEESIRKLTQEIQIDVKPSEENKELKELKERVSALEEELQNLREKQEKPGKDFANRPFIKESHDRMKKIV